MTEASAISNNKNSVSVSTLASTSSPRKWKLILLIATFAVIVQRLQQKGLIEFFYRMGKNILDRTIFDDTLPYRPIRFLQSQFQPPQPKHISELFASNKELRDEAATTTRKAYQALPNIVFIMADDLGYNGISGGAGVSTPHIDSIATNGIRFLNGYSGSATCSPSRAALLTGRYATKLGWEFTAAPKVSSKGFTFQSFDPKTDAVPIFSQENYEKAPEVYNMGMPKRHPHVATAMHDELGYWNYFLGKWDSGSTAEFAPRERGFHESLAFNVGASLYLPKNDPRVENSQGLLTETLYRLVLPFRISHNGEPYFTPNEYMTDYLSNNTVQLIHRLSERSKGDVADFTPPFYISVNYNTVHEPYQALKTDLEHPEVKKLPDRDGTNIERLHGAMVVSLDRGVGQILQALKDTNQYENTIVIFTSDNGPSDMGGLANLAKPYRGWKCTLFEGGIHVPFFMQWPRMFTPSNPAGITIKAPVVQMDLPASYLHLLDVTSSPLLSMPSGERFNNITIIRQLEESSRKLSSKHNFDGKSIWPVVFRELYEDQNHGMAIEIALEKEPPREIFWRSGHYKALRIGEMKMQVANIPNRIWYHNLTQDPYEYDNLALSVFNITSQDEMRPLLSIASHLFGSINTNTYFSSLLHRMLSHYQRLLQVDGEQDKALWEPVLQIPHCVDRTMSKVETRCGLDEEWVIWPN